MAAPTQEYGNDVKILHASLYRMGTWSMAKAYRTLGFNTFHALDESMSSMNWVLVEQAAEATWPTVPDALSRPPPFTRDDWDRLWGNHYDALCDTSGPFTLELFKAYPRAKVVLVQRDYDAWWPSFRAEILDKVFAPGLLVEALMFLAWHLVGFRGVHAMRRLLLGFFRAATREEIEENGREIYDRFFRQIRETVPPEQLLEYELGSGWEPLCEFLGKDVPDLPFPHVNAGKAHSAAVGTKQGNVFFTVSKKAALGATVVGIAAVAGWWLLGNYAHLDILVYLSGIPEADI